LFCLVDDDCPVALELNAGLAPAVVALVGYMLAPERRVNVVDLIVL
jgi:hypothetical protein